LQKFLVLLFWFYALFLLSIKKSNDVSLVVGLLVGGMLMSTSITTFANPQVTIARMFTYSDAGIRPLDAIIFIILQIFASFLAILVWKYSIKKLFNDALQLAKLIY